MGILRWVETAELDGFARLIAAEPVQRVPPSNPDFHDWNAADRLRSRMARFFACVGRFVRTHKLNINKWARPGNQFKWALKEAGYPPEFVESWTYELVTLITLISSARPEPGR